MSTFFSRGQQIIGAHSIEPQLTSAASTPSERGSEVVAFANLMEIAQRIGQHDPRGLSSLVSAILRPLKSEQILSAAERAPHAAREAIRFDQLFSYENFFSCFDLNDCVRSAGDAHQVDLSRDVVLTTPWVREGFASALANIGKGKKSGPWRQDPNHSVRWYCLGGSES